MTTDDNNGWDSLAEEFGLESSQEPPKAEKPAVPAARPAPRPAPRRPAHEPRAEPEPEADDFGSGVVNDTGRDQAALYDPGPDAVAEDAEDLGAAPEPFDEPEGEESPPAAEGAAEGHDGGKKRRRRRRRRKKGGPGAPEATASAEEGAEDSAPEAVEDGGVEEGEAPAEVEGDEEDETIPSAVDEEMEAEAAVPRNEWHVMTWNELVAKLHRPG